MFLAKDEVMTKEEVCERLQDYMTEIGRCQAFWHYKCTEHHTRHVSNTLSDDQHSLQRIREQSTTSVGYYVRKRRVQNMRQSITKVVQQAPVITDSADRESPKRTNCSRGEEVQWLVQIERGWRAMCGSLFSSVQVTFAFTPSMIFITSCWSTPYSSANSTLTLSRLA
jgi:hypothetical protein